MFILVKEYNWIKPTIDLEDLQNFQEKSQQYNTEAGKVINYAIYNAPSECLTGMPQQILANSECPPSKLSAFSEKFVDYAKQAIRNYTKSVATMFCR